MHMDMDSRIQYIFGDLLQNHLSSGYHIDIAFLHTAALGYVFNKLEANKSNYDANIIMLTFAF